MPDIILIAKSDQIARACGGSLHEVHPVAKPLRILEDVNRKRGCSRELAQ
jgi:hypothetical protein